MRIKQRDINNTHHVKVSVVMQQIIDELVSDAHRCTQLISDKLLLLHG